MKAAQEHTLRVKVNGSEYESRVDPRVSLADYLRDELGLKATHLGCEHGVCGICRPRAGKCALWKASPKGASFTRSKKPSSKSTAFNAAFVPGAS